MSDWLTYAEAGARFGISPEAVRQIAMRRKWPRRRQNDDPFGRVQVLISDDTEIRPRTGVQHQDERQSDTRPIGLSWTPCVTPWSTSGNGPIGRK